MSDTETSSTTKHRKRILYFGNRHERFDAFFLGMVRAEETYRSPSDARTVLYFEDGLALEFLPTFVPDQALEMLREHYVNLLVLDLRHTSEFEAQVAAARQLLRTLDHAEDLELRYGFHRILVLVSGPDIERLDQVVLELGARGIRHVLRESRDDQRWEGPADPQSDAFAARALRHVVGMLRDRRTGKSALCASGGGITGIHFEIGALKCLDDCLVDRSVNDFDMMFGISAGAVVTSLLAVGYTIDEVMASVAGAEGGRIGPLDLSVLKARHFNGRELAWRASTTLRQGFRRTLRAIRGKHQRETWFSETVGALGAPFNSAGFEQMLHKLLDAPGATNDFRRLPRPLYIGASDQDARQHVLFGSEGYEHVPISRAVQGSLSFNPAFAAVEIEGRWYEDGAITRTSDFVEAIDRGADLVFILDPFVPYVSDRPGLAHQRGLLYNLDQNIRTISYTRFESVRNYALRRHPEVSTYTFLPSNRQRKLLSKNPLDHRPYLPIWRAAYLSTLKRIKAVAHRMKGDLAEHGMTFDCARAEAVAERLGRTPRPVFNDFFVDGAPVIRHRPLLR